MYSNAEVTKNNMYAISKALQKVSIDYDEDKVQMRRRGYNESLDVLWQEKFWSFCLMQDFERKSVHHVSKNDYLSRQVRNVSI